MFIYFDDIFTFIFSKLYDFLMQRLFLDLLAACQAQKRLECFVTLEFMKLIIFNCHGLFRNPKYFSSFPIFDIKEMCGRLAVIYVLYFYVLFTF
jgi:hypothetical protein